VDEIALNDGEHLLDLRLQVGAIGSERSAQDTLVGVQRAVSDSLETSRHLTQTPSKELLTPGAAGQFSFTSG
jgi:hypothetical protein